MDQQLDVLKKLIDAAVKGGLFQNAESVVIVQDAFEMIRAKLTNGPVAK